MPPRSMMETLRAHGRSHGCIGGRDASGVISVSRVTILAPPSSASPRPARSCTSQAGSLPLPRGRWYGSIGRDDRSRCHSSRVHSSTLRLSPDGERIAVSTFGSGPGHLGVRTRAPHAQQALSAWTGQRPRSGRPTANVSLMLPAGAGRTHFTGCALTALAIRTARSWTRESGPGDLDT